MVIIYILFKFSDPNLGFVGVSISKTQDLLYPIQPFQSRVLKETVSVLCSPLLPLDCKLNPLSFTSHVAEQLNLGRENSGRH